MAQPGIPLLTTLVVLLALSAPALADPIFFDDFNDGFTGWTSSGDVSPGTARSLVPNAVRLRQGGTLSRSFSTLGWQDVEVGFFVGARRLENADRCVVEISSDGGNNWNEVKALTDDEDDSRMRWGLESAAAYDNNGDLRIRYRTELNNNDDECYAENVSLSGFPLGSQSCDLPPPRAAIFPGFVSDFDPLSGNGITNRTVLTETILSNGPAPASPVLTGSGFALPVNAAAPLHQFEGRLELIGEATGGSFLERQDDFNYTDGFDDPRKHLPEFDFEFLQSGTHLIPLQRGITVAEHPDWEFIVEPGRVWSEAGDVGQSRAVIPFSLQQRNANCMHNGLMTFLFDGVSVSKAYYQIASETCAYFQFDMWGLLDASYTPQVISGASQIASDHQQSLANRMPQKSIADLAIDYPGVNSNEFANPAEVSPLDLSIFGVIVDGTHYVGGCETRYGTHPYCDALRVPSYSTSKTSLAATGAMRLEKLHGDFFSQIIADWVSEAAADPQGDFNDVTINNALDMSTGNFTLPGYFDDESASASNGFFLPETYAEKIDFAVNQYPRQATPGTQMHYHTSDTFLAMTAAQSYHRDKVGFCGDVFDDVVVDDIWAPLGFDAGSLSARRTYDPVQQPIGGLGASYLRDDIAKLGQFLGVDHGRIDNVQVLEPEQLAAGKFGTAADPGLSWISSGLYNNAFWGLNRASIAGCAGLFVPYMSGFGGITIAIAPSGIVYYYFSDGYSVTWNRAFAEAEEIRSSCITGPPNPPLDLVIVEEQAEAVTLRWTPGPTPINVMRFRVYRDGVAIALTSGNEWTDNAITPGKDHVYYVEAVDVIGLVSTTGAVLTFEPGVFNIPAMPTVAAILVSLALVSVAVRRRH